MSFSQSLFTIDVNGVPTATFEAKWHSEADAICRSWVNRHWEQLQAKGRHGSDLPPVVKTRLSRIDEQERFAGGGVSIELLEDVKIVHLVDVGS